jgi:monoamine oxidase
MFAQAESRPGFMFKGNHKLVSIERVRGARARTYRLTFQITDLRSPDPPKFSTFLARNIILALPKGSLKQIRFERIEGWSERDWDLMLNSVTDHPLFKLFLAYDRAWWPHRSALGAQSGRAVTDLPIRQVYYFKPDSKQRGLLMACYSDEHYVDYWRPVMTLEEETKSENYFYEGDEVLAESEKRDLRLLGISRRIVSKAQRQLKKMHPEMGDDIPEPFVGLGMYWTGEDGEGVGWHTWNPHKSPWETARKLCRPFHDIYTCGEAYSLEQGWAEGALKSAEMVLRVMGLKPPSWVKQTNYRRLKYANHDEYVGL